MLHLRLLRDCRTSYCWTPPWSATWLVLITLRHPKHRLMPLSPPRGLSSKLPSLWWPVRLPASHQWQLTSLASTLWHVHSPLVDWPLECRCQCSTKVPISSHRLISPTLIVRRRPTAMTAVASNIVVGVCKRTLAQHWRDALAIGPTVVALVSSSYKVTSMQ